MILLDNNSAQLNLRCGGHSTRLGRLHVVHEPVEGELIVDSLTNIGHEVVGTGADTEMLYALTHSSSLKNARLIDVFG